MKKIVFVSLLAIFLFSFKTDSLEEGMFPMSQLNSLDLKSAGLEISTNDIYDESKPALANGSSNDIFAPLPSFIISLRRFEMLDFPE